MNSFIADKIARAIAEEVDYDIYKDIYIHGEGAIYQEWEACDEW